MRRFILPLLCILLSTTAMAQVGELRSNLAVGFNGGCNLSRVDFSPTIKQNLQPGLTGGITLRYTTEKYFALICAAQLEVNIAQRGWNELIEDGTNNTYHRVTNYVEIPFFAHPQTRGVKRGSTLIYHSIKPDNAGSGQRFSSENRSRTLRMHMRTPGMLLSAGDSTLWCPRGTLFLSGHRLLGIHSFLFYIIYHCSRKVNRNF